MQASWRYKWTNIQHIGSRSYDVSPIGDVEALRYARHHTHFGSKHIWHLCSLCCSTKANKNPSTDSQPTMELSGKFCAKRMTHNVTD